MSHEFDCNPRFYLYKLPHHTSHIDGLKYLLMEKSSEGWVDGTGLVNDSTGALARTMGPLYEVWCPCCNVSERHGTFISARFSIFVFVLKKRRMCRIETAVAMLVELPLTANYKMIMYNE